MRTWSYSLYIKCQKKRYSKVLSCIARGSQTRAAQANHALSLFISWFICSGWLCMDTLGVFHANQTPMCLDPHLNWGWGWRCETSLSHPVKYFPWLFRGGIFVWLICVIYVLCFSCFCVCSLLPCGHLLRKGWPLGACLWCFIVFFHFPMW